MARMKIDRGRVNFEPNSLVPDGPRETPRGFATFPQPVTGTKVRERSETFSDHYSQARMFYRSMTPTEQRHIVAAFTFELSKVETVSIRTRMLGHLDIIDTDLGAKVADGLGMVGLADRIEPVRAPIELPPSPALSILAKAPATLQGRKVGALISDGFDEKLLVAVRAAVLKEGAMFEVVAPKVGLATTSEGKKVVADHMIAGGPSVIFDAVVVIPGAESVGKLVAAPPALDWVSDAFNHCKVIGTVAAAQPLLEAARVKPDAGVIDLGGKGVAKFIDAAKRGRIWAREEAQADKPPTKRPPPAPPKPSAKPRAAARR
jgi:catalase